MRLARPTLPARVTRWRTPRRDVAMLLAAGAVLRLALLQFVAIWGDLGFYTYDARLLQAGEMPFVDFAARSPLFNEGYALVSEAVGRSWLTARFYVGFWWMLASPVVYLFARDIHSHRAGLAGLALYLLAPFGAVYGAMVLTQSLAALLAVLGAYLLYRQPEPRWAAVAGILFGAAFLTRRSVVAVCAGVGLWMLWDHRRRGTWRAFGARTAAVTAGAIATPALGYLLMAGFDGALAWQLFDTHALGLVTSAGRGGFPFISDAIDAVKPGPAETAANAEIPVLHWVCQKCGSWTVKTIAKSLFILLPAIAPLAVYVRDVSRRFIDPRALPHLAGILGILAAYGFIIALANGFVFRAAALAALATIIAAVYRGERIADGVLYSRGAVLLGAVTLAIVAAYFYRNRLIHTVYYLDIWPFLTGLTGVILAAGHERWDGALPRCQRATWRNAVALGLAVALVTSAAAAVPLATVAGGNNEGWFTPDNIDEITASLETTVADDTLLTAIPAYVAGTDVRLWQDRPRIHYFLVSFNNSEFGDSLYREMERELRRGDIEYVVLDGLTANMVTGDAGVQAAFTDHYCVADRAPYDAVGGALLAWTPDASQCPAGDQAQEVLHVKNP